MSSQKLKMITVVVVSIDKQ